MIYQVGKFDAENFSRVKYYETFFVSNDLATAIYYFAAVKRLT